MTMTDEREAVGTDSETHFEQSLRGLEERLMGPRDTSDDMAEISRRSPEVGHTPGMWTIDPKSINAPNGTRYTVYTLRGGPDICDGHAQSREVEANARLIAAAPALLGELEAILDDYADALGEERYERACAAIRAARGEE